MAEVIGDVFAEVLEAHRPALNTKFATAQRLHPGLEPEDFADVLRELVAPVVISAEQFDLACARSVALVLYDLALDLLAQGFLGPKSRSPVITQGWRSLLPGIPQQICAAPRLIIGSITNALYNLSQSPDARPQEWLETMSALAPLTDAVLYLRAGQVAAWRAGLAHFRVDALNLCRTLPPALVYSALRLPAPNASESADELIDRLAADPWLHPDLAIKLPEKRCTLKVVRQVGAFRGFGGLFLQPPKVFAAGDHFLIVDGESHWLLVADVFGATLHRVDGVEAREDTKPFDIDKKGGVRFAHIQQTFDELAGYTSAASNGKTLAVTSALSFAISLVAPVES